MTQIDRRLNPIPPPPRPIEWPTIILTILIYGLWLGLTWFHASIPGPLLLIGGAWVIAWHGSLQHEFIHGHPTSAAALNRALGLPALALFLPFDRYRALHIAHHRNEYLTDPLEDPETYYWTATDWHRLHPAGRFIVRSSARLAGRLVIGPFWMIGRFLCHEAARARRNEPGVRAAWATHLPIVCLILLWVCGICGMNPLSYALVFILPGTALLMIRSFAEHRAAPTAEHRTAVVENAHLLGWLFLFNNLHSAHHERPSLPWYRLPGWYRQERTRLLHNNGGLVYQGYDDIIRRYLLHPHDQPVHPQDGRVRRV
jgi:fatty acid desaturase